MRIAVIGGGVIGLVYAAGLARANHEVVIRGRGARAQSLAKNGVFMAEMGAEPLFYRPTMVETLPDNLDWVLVAVRSGELDAAAAPLLEGGGIVPILTLANAPQGLADRRARE